MHNGYEELGLPPVLDVARRLVGDVLPAEALDHVEGHVDARGHAGGGDDAVVDHAQLALDLRSRAERFQEIERRPVGGGAPALQKPGLPQDERAGADRGDLPGCRGGAPDPVQGLLVVEEGTGAEPAGHDQEVDPGRVREVVVGDHDQPAGRGDRVLGLRHGEDVEGSAVVRPAGLRPGDGPGAGEDLERSREVEDLDVVEDQDADVLAHWASLADSGPTRRLL